MTFHVSVHCFQNTLFRRCVFTTAANRAKSRTRARRMSGGSDAGRTAGKAASAGAGDTQSADNDFLQEGTAPQGPHWLQDTEWADSALWTSVKDGHGILTGTGTQRSAVWFGPDSSSVETQAYARQTTNGEQHLVAVREMGWRLGHTTGDGSCLVDACARSALRLQHLWELMGWTWNTDIPLTSMAWREYICAHIEQNEDAYTQNMDWMIDGLEHNWGWPQLCRHCKGALATTSSTEKNAVEVTHCAHLCCNRKKCRTAASLECQSCQAAFASPGATKAQGTVLTAASLQMPSLSDVLRHPELGIDKHATWLWHALLHIVAFKFAELQIPDRVSADGLPLHVTVWYVPTERPFHVHRCPPVNLQGWRPEDAPSRGTKASKREWRQLLGARLRPDCTGRVPAGATPPVWDVMVVPYPKNVHFNYAGPVVPHTDDHARLFQLLPAVGTVGSVAVQTKNPHAGVCCVDDETADFTLALAISEASAADRKTKDAASWSLLCETMQAQD